MKYDAVVVASGNSVRADLGFNKVFFVMKNNKTVLENACEVFINDEDCQKIIVVTNEKEKVFKNNKVEIIEGGKERKDSVKNGLTKTTSDYVFIHDGARPFLNKQDVDKLKESLNNADGAILVSKNVNTIKEVKNGFIERTLDREYVYNALTPQAFKTGLIKEAYNTLDLSGITDDSLVFEKKGYKVRAIEGDPTNIKLTNRKDFENI